MRKITIDSCKAFNENQSFKSKNTEIIIESDKTKMVLHDNVIAIKENNILKITNCGYFTNVTKERLNGLPNVNIYQKNYNWYLNGYLWNGELAIVTKYYFEYV